MLHEEPSYAYTQVAFSVLQFGVLQDPGIRFGSLGLRFWILI
jgi:hypothetical protein